VAVAVTVPESDSEVVKTRDFGTAEEVSRNDSVATAPRDQKSLRFEETQTHGWRGNDLVARNVSMTNTHTTGIIGRIGAWAHRSVGRVGTLIKA